MQFSLQYFLVNQLGFVFSHKRWGKIAAECIFHDFTVFAFAQYHANASIFMRGKGTFVENVHNSKLMPLVSGFIQLI